MPMPEAAVNEDRDLSSDQHDVRPPRQFATMKPEPDAEPMQEAADDPLRRRVLAAHGGHDAGAFGRCDSVHLSGVRENERTNQRTNEQRKGEVPNVDLLGL